MLNNAQLQFLDFKDKYRREVSAENLFASTPDFRDAETKKKRFFKIICTHSANKTIDMITIITARA